ncbi:MAG: ABC transporter permease subunit [Natronospirillum sp.]|uniref:ABC transporter permease subunit n=1 Tax=Natronospirillum sp. TaxID=2812955 RepID=UPI0025EEF6A3|nr:ABC transporter permease subunit [Natronospirillum sp.]MCH8551220.1 ABC transporter permease subunit [Natronospirillum sp.]
MTDLVRTEGDNLPPARSLLPDAETRMRRRKWRMVRDGISRWGITAAGFGVIFSLTLIFAYLFYEVAPILRGAQVSPQIEYDMPGLAEGATVSHLVMERYRTLGAMYADDGMVTFFEMTDGTVRTAFPTEFPVGTQSTSFAAAEPTLNITAYGLSNGQAMVLQHDYEISFPEGNVRHIEPQILYPFGEDPITLDEQGQPLELLAVQKTDRGASRLGLAGVTADERLLLAILSTQENMMTGEVTVSSNRFTLPEIPGTPVKLLLDKGLRNLFVATDDGMLHYYDVSSPAQARLVNSLDVGEGEAITAMDFLVGSISVITGTADGRLMQSFVVRDAANERTLRSVRTFDQHPGAIRVITPEYTRKGFIVGDETGTLGIHYGTSSRTLLKKSMYENAVENIAIDPRVRALLTVGETGRVQVSTLWNQHPQLSFKALWNRVWYEGQAEPEFTWQSSAARDEVESKFSLAPLTLGTIKAAFYAMLFAMPLGLLGAIYTAYFMTPKLRGAVKPVIEVMEALPTVILGFLAGLWLAPFLESHLPAVFAILIFMPLSMIGMAALWKFAPGPLKRIFPAGWEFVVVIPIILLIGWLSVYTSPFVEIAFFDGSMRQWLTDNDITYDQRNALVVGIAMGFAVIPTIYSIAEDAVFNVPKHLTQGSLALGATSWQTVVGVVIPTASPGMFSAIMIGMGRAVGETMIVLMATGNSPIMNFNIFEGMRTLSANIAVELPETAVGSSHFRILFLAALVLFVLTFVLNTAAEIVRQRLRRKYSSL